MEYKYWWTPEERKQLIAGKLLTLRSQKGYTQKEVAEKIGIKLGTYNAYEKARSEPSGEIVIRLAYLYDVSADDILEKNNLLKDPEKAKELNNQFEDAWKIIQDKLANGTDEEKKIIAEEFGKQGETLNNLMGNLLANIQDETK